METTLGVTGPQHLVLKMVARFPHITAGQLAHLLHTDPSTLTGIVQRLLRRGLLQRRADTQDRRRLLLGLTAEGRRLGLATSAGVEQTVGKTLGRLAPRDVAAARKTLTSLADALGRAAGAPAGRATGVSSGLAGPRTTTGPARRTTVTARRPRPLANRERVSRA